jgi:hypothetical protein
MYMWGKGERGKGERIPQWSEPTLSFFSPSIVSRSTEGIGAARRRAAPLHTEVEFTVLKS